jgi:hypothetical protein
MKVEQQANTAEPEFGKAQHQLVFSFLFFRVMTQLPEIGKYS